MKMCRFCTVLIMFLLAQGAAAGQWNTLSSGGLYNDAGRGQNNYRYTGAGLQYEFDHGGGNWVNFVTASQIIDANQDEAYLAGGGIAKRLALSSGKDQLRLDLGLVACAMQRNDYNEGDTIFAAVPTFSLGNRKVAVNVSYVSNPQYDLGKVWILQLKIAQNKLW